MAKKPVVPGKVLFVTMDHMRADLLTGRLANAAKLPNIRKLMAEGVTFSNHFSVTTPCGPARASLLTGLYAMNHRAVRNGTPLAAHHTNLALELRKAGREPLLFGYTDTTADPFVHHPDDPALQSYEGLLPGFVEVIQMRLETSYPWVADLAAKGYDVSDYRALLFAADPDSDDPQAPTVYTAEDSDTAFLTNALIGHLEARRGQDWFAHLAYIRPHPPLVAPAPWNTLHDPREIPEARATADLAAERAMHPLIDAMLAGPRMRSLYTGFDGMLTEMRPETRQALMAVYMGLAAEVDHHLGRIFDWLKATGQWDDTLIILSCDHGEMLGEHFMWGKATVYDPCFHVPLVIRDPRNRGAAGTVVDAFVESIDLAPTILDWVGGKTPAAFDGVSLMPFLEGRTPEGWRDHVFMEIEFGDPAEPQVAQTQLGLALREANAAILREGRWKYIHFNGGLPPLLFDLEADPAETRNLADAPEHQGELSRLARRMLDHRMTHAFGAHSAISITDEGPVYG